MVMFRYRTTRKTSCENKTYTNPLFNVFHSSSGVANSYAIYIYIYIYSSSTWCEFDPNTAYVICISICPYFLIWYPYALTSLYGNTAHCSGYGVAIGCYIDSALSEWPLLWRHNDMTVIVSRNTRGRERDSRQRQCTAITDCQSIDSL